MRRTHGQVWALPPQMSTAADLESLSPAALWLGIDQGDFDNKSCELSFAAYWGPTGQYAGVDYTVDVMQQEAAVSVAWRFRAGGIVGLLVGILICMVPVHTPVRMYI